MDTNLCATQSVQKWNIWQDFRDRERTQTNYISEEWGVEVLGETSQQTLGEFRES